MDKGSALAWIVRITRQFYTGEWLSVVKPVSRDFTVAKQSFPAGLSKGRSSFGNITSCCKSWTLEWWTGHLTGLSIGFCSCTVKQTLRSKHSCSVVSYLTRQFFCFPWSCPVHGGQVKHALNSKHSYSIVSYLTCLFFCFRWSFPVLSSAICSSVSGGVALNSTPIG